MATRKDLSYSHILCLPPALPFSSTSYSSATVLFKRARSPVSIAAQQSTEPTSLLLLPE